MMILSIVLCLFLFNYALSYVSHPSRCIDTTLHATILGGRFQSKSAPDDDVYKSIQKVITDHYDTKSKALPWKQSVVLERELVYMPMLEQQLNVIKAMKMEEVTVDEKFIYRKSDNKPAVIGNLCFKNERFRSVRLSYFDAGDACQVFNSLWYPSYEYDIPLLGVDLISLGKNRVLSVIDFQPLHPTSEYSAKYIQPLTKIRDKYSDLKGTLSGKFYDDTSFFSKNMLFGRFTDESKLKSVVLPAYNEYLNEYIKLMDKAVPNNNAKEMEIVKNRQIAYDVYSAAKDPAIGLFDAYFGKEWSASFVHDFLFTLSKTNDSGSPSVPVHNFQLTNTGTIASQKKY
jgi:15,16-dihydrobiliverdin:ferredoxin oxidoreductase